MLVFLALYLVLGFVILTLLARMILRVGEAMATCPDARPGIRAAALTIVTGYCALGAGGLILIAIAFPVMQAGLPAIFLGALGVALMALGLGFSNAVATLRAVTQPPARAPSETQPGIPETAHPA